MNKTIIRALVCLLGVVFGGITICSAAGPTDWEKDGLSGRVKLLTAEIRSVDNGKELSSAQYAFAAYDPNGRVMERMEEVPENPTYNYSNYKNTVAYVYDANSKLKEKVVYANRKENRILGKTMFSYDPLGRILEQTFVEDNRVRTRQTYQNWDSSNRRVERVMESFGSEYALEVVTFNEFDQVTAIDVLGRHNRRYEYSHKFEYNAKGQIMEEQRYVRKDLWRGDPELFPTRYDKSVKYIRDAGGNILAMTAGQTGAVTRTFKFTYTYDAKGNPLKALYYESEMKNGQAVMTHKANIYYKIAYY